MAREEWYVEVPPAEGVASYQLTHGLVRDVEVREGLYRTAGSRGEDRQVGGRNGRLWTPRPLEAGAFTLRLWLGDPGSSREQLEAWYDELLRFAYSPWRLMQWRRRLASGLERVALGYVSDAVEPQPIGQRGMRAGLSVTVPAGVWRDTADTEDERVGAIAAAGNDLALTSKQLATGPMEELAVELRGPGTDLRVVDRLTGRGFTYTGALAAGAIVTVNSATWQVAGGDVARLRYDGPRFLTAHPRPGSTPLLRLTGTGTDATTRVRVVGRRAWLV